MAAHDKQEICRVLNDLIQLDYDAIEAYRAAAERLQSPALRARIEEFMIDHERHTVNLSAQVIELGGTPASSADLMRVLTKGAVVIGGLMNDKGILEAMSSNEAITNAAYDSALQKLAGEPTVDRVVRQNRDDERRHKKWIDAALDSGLQSAA